MAIQVRSFRPSDSEFITSLITRFTEFDLPAWRSADEINYTNHSLLLQAMAQPEPDSALLIAEDETGRRAGFIHLQTQTDYFNGEKHGYISDLAVDQAFEGQGVGGLLLETAEAWSRAKGYDLLTLYVFAGNRRAQRLYEKHGFGPELIKYVKKISE
ncbi:MAG: GNAT family N-acetyltransferase [Anaerolineae bacterium]|nr:GNAT family N-acetyltransferase [Anaerolineales bacterium]MCQ3975457.1 GNAT family N-acetyltransferase [Anaerolineae bacterium]